MPKKSPASSDIQALDLAKQQGAFGAAPPPVRKPSRGAMGGAVPRGARTRMPPTMAPAGRGGKRATPKRKVKK
jgi:hypothetical protein